MREKGERGKRRERGDWEVEGGARERERDGMKGS